MASEYHSADASISPLESMNRPFALFLAIQYVQDRNGRETERRREILGLCSPSFQSNSGVRSSLRHNFEDLLSRHFNMLSLGI